MSTPRYKAEMAVIQAICALFWQAERPFVKRARDRMDEAFARATQP